MRSTLVSPCGNAGERAGGCVPKMLAVESLKAPGNPSERVNDMDRWSALALNERKREYRIWNQCVSRAFPEARDVVASSSEL